MSSEEDSTRNYKIWQKGRKQKERKKYKGSNIRTDKGIRKGTRSRTKDV